MARIPQEDIEKIKADIPVEQLVRGRGIQLRQHGENLLGLCPFHDDHEPSLVVTPSKNLWNCLGACQAGGDVIAWVQKSEGLSFRHAVELLRADFVPVSSAGSTVKKASIPKLAAPVSLDMKDHELTLRIIDFYNDQLKGSPEALRYLESRGLQSSEMIDRFRLGFANRTLGFRLPAMNRREGWELRTRLQKIGVLRDTGHEHFNGSIVIPVFDEDGRVSEMYGRKITPNLRKGTPLHLYLHGPHRGVFNLEAVRSSKEIILCEALIDALTFWCAGYQNVTSSFGIGGFTEDHLAAFRRYGTERVLIAYDRDEAGDRAAEALAPKLIAEGMSVYRIEFPKGMDANELARKMSPPAKALGVLIRSARWLGGVTGERTEVTVITPQPAAEESDESEEEPVEEPAPSLAAAVPLVEASPAVPPKIEESAPIAVKNDDVLFEFGDRRYRIRGLKRNTSFDSLRVNVMVTRNGPLEPLFLDTFDLCVARQRAAFEKQAAAEIGVKEEVVHHDLGKILRELETLREAEIAKALEPKSKAVVVSEAERIAALEHLQAPDLLARTVEHLTRAGLVGEETNKLAAYIAAVSRKLDEPLAIIIQSSSSAGKTALMDAILALTPEEEQVRYSAVTGKALFYISDETSLRHKILAISEEEGAEQASYAIKLLQSEGHLTIASTGKDPATGKLVTQEYRVEGPVMIFLTTTAIDIDEELLNRCIVLTVDEEREQTRAIHRLQREAQTLEGLIGRRERDHLRKLHHNVQRMLKPIHVVNPFAPALTFLDGRTRTRRDHMKYLTLIRCVALLHQYQRPKKTTVHRGETIEYIEVTPADIDVANKLAHEILGRSLDELAPQTRRLLGLVDEMVTRECKRLAMSRCDFVFSRKTVREFSGWSDFQVKTHMQKLEELEYVLVHRGSRGQSFVYELLYQGQGKAGDAFLMGLVDPTSLHQYDGKLEQLKEELEHRDREKEHPRSPQLGPKEAGWSVGENAIEASADAALSVISPETADKSPLGTRVYTLHRSGNGREPAPFVPPALAQPARRRR